MKNLWLGAVGLAVLSCPAFAADLPMRPAAPVAAVFSWTGLYVGANVGWHSGSDSITTTSNPVGFPPPINTNIDALSPTTLKPQGATGGFQMGYNWQINNFVFGLEGDANWLGGTASRHLVFPAANSAPGSPMDNSTSGRFLATFRPRAGITFDRLFLYATGGMALGSIKTTDSYCNDGCAIFNGISSTPVSASGSATKVGWTAGAGAEWAITDTWSIKAEYLYVNLGSFDASIPGAQSQNPANLTCSQQGGGAGGPPSFGVGNCSILVHHNYTDNIVRIGVNYHFGAGY